MERDYISVITIAGEPIQRALILHSVEELCVARGNGRRFVAQEFEGFLEL